MILIKNVPQSKHVRFEIKDGDHAGIYGVPGWHTVPEEELLINLARSIPQDGLIVELGGEYGRSAAEFAYGTTGSQVQIITIDKFPLDHIRVGDLMQAYINNLKACGLFKRVTPVRAQTQDKEIAARYGGRGIDLLFIDAGHFYKDVQGDIETWLPYVKANGIVIFHDYAKDEQAHWTHHEVKRAVEDYIADNPNALRYGGMADSTRWYTKVEQPQKTIEDPIMTQKEAASFLGLSIKDFKALGLPKTKVKGRRNMYLRETIESAEYK